MRQSYHHQTTATRAMKDRANWMARFEEQLVGKRPELRGKVDWNTATYLFLAGRDAIEAANTIAERISTN